jgi:hypothetical protein
MTGAEGMVAPDPFTVKVRKAIRSQPPEETQEVTPGRGSEATRIGAWRVSRDAPGIARAEHVYLEKSPLQGHSQGMG